MIVCVYENRPDCETGVRLLILSLKKYSPTLIVHLYFAAASIDFLQWIGHLNNVRMIDMQLDQSLHWNVKPTVLLNELHSGETDIVWIDSDVIVTGAIEEKFFGLAKECLVITEEALYGSHYDGQSDRARLWGFSIGRSFGFSLNTCVLRITTYHVPLLERWQSLLSNTDYLAAQRLPHRLRSIHMIGDQDVLTALLCSKAFSDFPVKVLHRGKDILQLHGIKAFTLKERIECLMRTPIFLHAQGQKPWLNVPKPRSVFEYFWAAYLDASPYSLVAKRYNIHPNPFLAKTRLGKVCRILGFGSMSLTGLPLSLYFETIDRAVQRIKLLRPRWKGRKL